MATRLLSAGILMGILQLFGTKALYATVGGLFVFHVAYRLWFGYWMD